MARNENFNSRWGDSELDDTGYITVPGWIMRNYHRYTDPDGNVVGITPHEFTFMCHVMSFKYDVAGSKAKPSLQTVARLMGRHITNVRNIKNGMAKKAALTVTEIPGAPNVYDFGNLVRQCRRFEFERASEITTPSETAGGTPSEIASPPLVKPLAKEVETTTRNSKNENKSAPNGADPEMHKSISAILDAWKTHSGVVIESKKNIYAIAAYRSKAQALYEAGITGEDVADFIAFLRQDSFWRGKGIDLAKIQKDILPWKSQHRPNAGASPAQRTAPRVIQVDADMSELDAKLGLGGSNGKR